MNDRGFGNTDPDFVINQLLSQDQSNIKKIAIGLIVPGESINKS